MTKRTGPSEDIYFNRSAAPGPDAGDTTPSDGAKAGDQYWNYVDSIVDKFDDGDPRNGEGAGRYGHLEDNATYDSDTPEGTGPRFRGILFHKKKDSKTREEPSGTGNNPPRRNAQRPPQNSGQRPPQYTNNNGQRPPQNGQRPPQNGQRPPQYNGQRPPQNGQRPPQYNGQRPPQNGQRPPRYNGQRPPQNGQRPPQNGQRPPQYNGQRPNGQGNVRNAAVNGAQRPPQNGQRPPQNGPYQPQGKPKKTFKEKFLANFPQSGDSVGEIIRKLVVIISALVLVGCAIYFIYTGIQAQQNKSATNNLSSMVEENEGKDWDEIRAKYPGVNFPAGMQTKFAGLYAKNQDLVGWIKIPGLGIDYPVMKTTDDTYYLKHNFNKQYTPYGCPFLSAANNVKELDQNSVIYGHSMRRDNQMFTPLKAYREIDGFKENPVIEFDTLYHDYYFKVYAVFLSNGEEKDDNGYLFHYNWTNFQNQEDFTNFVQEINSRKLYKTGVDITTTDKLLTLSTCNYDFDSARLVIIGRMVRDGESQKVSTRKAEIHKNPRFPQAWYDAKHEKNPYANAKKWVPTES